MIGSILITDNYWRMMPWTQLFKKKKTKTTEKKIQHGRRIHHRLFSWGIEVNSILSHFHLFQKRHGCLWLRSTTVSILDKNQLNKSTAETHTHTHTKNTPQSHWPIFPQLKAVSHLQFFRATCRAQKIVAGCKSVFARVTPPRATWNFHFFCCAKVESTSTFCNNC